MKKVINFDNFVNFRFKIKHSVLMKETHHYQINSHVHDEVELYINVSGDISFMVENKIYDAKSGNIIISKPGEYHNCIYRSNAPHEHFWILLSPHNTPIKQMLCKIKGSLIAFNQSERDQVIDLCRSLLKSDGIEQYMLVLNLLCIIEQNGASEPPKNNNLPKEVDFFLKYINENFTENIEIKDIAKELFVSVSTLERAFKTHLNMTPSEYIRDRRLCLAANYLRSGINVSTAANLSGFCDSSHFICRFKQKFNTTPLKYQKQFFE